MPTVDRMFRVIVAGGIALSASAPGLVVGCGGSVSTLPSDAGHGSDAFPQEGPPPYEPDAFPQETAQLVDAFPQEGIDASMLGDAGSHGDAAQDVSPDVFPQEGPNLEAGSFDSSFSDADAGFPFETASP
ncbi:MAG TPA: hypothetical protein VHS09_15785 [Polyangiaceae bacterium]|jgi:hypothetical protein|nr:hypothetical protein [Polyangiaceae bacterium]